MDISKLSKEELFDLKREVEVTIDLILYKELKERLKDNSILKKYGFLFFKEEDEFRIGFCSSVEFEEDGILYSYIDDNVPEENQDDYSNMLEFLPKHSFETNSCTYYIRYDDIPQVMSTLNDLGLKQHQPAW